MRGSDIRELREKLGLTQEEFARLLGVNFVTVNRWENDKAVPKGNSKQVLLRIKELVEEAEKGKGITMQDLRSVVSEVTSGSLVGKLAGRGIIPTGALGMLAFSGLTALAVGLLLKLLDREGDDSSEKESESAGGK